MHTFWIRLYRYIKRAWIRVIRRYSNRRDKSRIDANVERFADRL